MRIDEVKTKISKYISNGDKHPLIVDVCNLKDLNELILTHVGLNKISLYEISQPDNLISTSDFFEILNSQTKNILICGIGTYLKLLGKISLCDLLHRLLSMTFKIKIVCLTYQCSYYFSETDPRYRDNYLIVDGEQGPSCSFDLLNLDIKSNLEGTYEGIRSILDLAEKFEGKKFLIKTNHSKNDYANSLFSIGTCQNYFELLGIYDNKAKNLLLTYGSDDNWHLLCKKFNKTLEDTINDYIGNTSIETAVEKWTSWSPFEKWLVFLKSKLSASQNWCIDHATAKSNNYEEFIKNIYNSILSVNHKEPDFWSKYKTWKLLIHKINDEDLIYKYCKIVLSKEELSLYYLTDNSEIEKQKLIECIDKYKDGYSKKKLLNILSNIYPDLYNYLCDYNLGNELLNDYFRNYKYQKVTNSLWPEFKSVVDEEAIKRSYNYILPFRSELIERIKYNDSEVFFIDALGVEFLSFIEKKCNEYGLKIKSSICKCNLPSLTNYNTEFRKYYEKHNIKLNEEKRLDSLKHDGIKNYDYEKVSFPIHLIEELEIIDDCLKNIKAKIKSEAIKKAIIISDHGASRLAILNTDEVKEDVLSVGEHGGRVCKVVPGMKRIANAIEEGDNYVLADYNSIKGGRKGKVEMHGGATIEEVTVPIIEIVANTIDLEIVVDDKPIKVSFKTPAILCFFASSKLKKVTVIIEGKEYKATSEDGQRFAVVLDDIKKPKKYSFDVYSNGELISSGKEFIIEKESAKINNLF